MSATAQFRSLATRVVDRLLAADPVEATWLGDHRFDDRLTDRSAAGVAQLRAGIDDDVTDLDAIDDGDLDLADRVDLEILRSALLALRFELAEIRSYEWDPMEWNPGTALHLLVTREFASHDERGASARGRLAAVPDHFASAREQLSQSEMSQPHVETAIAQLAGTRHLFDTEARELAADDVIVDRAIAAVDEFSAWLAERVPDARRDPRLGERLYAARLWHRLDDDVSADELLDAAEIHLDLVNAQLLDAASEYLGRQAKTSDDVREALDRVATSSPVTDASVLDLMREAMDRTTAFVRDHGLATVPDLDVQVIEMPEIHRGVAVAYCDAPGPLESARVPTFVAVSPAPADWTAERVASFYREYNGVQLHNLTVHEAMPGHVLQLAHAQQVQTSTPVRRFGSSGVFIEGWAVYTEELMVERGYGPADDDASRVAMRLQQLKMQARATINAILDVSVHAREMTEDEGMSLMLDRGFQEQGEAVGKWRRAILTAGQLPTYFVGYRAVSSIAHDLRVLHSDWSDQQVHDLTLSQGSPAPRHLRTLLGI